MARREALKNSPAEQRLFANRALFAAFVTVALALALLARLTYLQIASYEHFITLSQSNRVRLVAVAPPRGLIFDRNGAVLAENLPTYRLEITPSEVLDLDKTLVRLGEVIEIDPVDLTQFREALARKQPFEAVPLLFNLGHVEVARFAVNRHHFPGVEIAAHLGRYYPFAGAAVHALGYVGRIDQNDLRNVDAANYKGTTHIGKLGIEKYYESLLHGEAGFQRVEINAQGRTLRVLDSQAPVPGRDLMLSLDIGLQQVAEQALGEFNGAVVAMDPRNGEILALASKPIYDPNLFVNGISARAYGELRGNPDRPLFNRALTGQYPPGSTIKPFMALAGLQNGVTSPDRTINAGPYYQLPGHERKYHDWKEGGHGVVDLSMAIMRSVDVYFYDLAHRLGIDRMHDFLAHFGLGEENGVDSTGEADGLLPSQEWKRRVRGQVWFPGETVIAGIGQGYMLSTPLQLATATSTLAMQGRRPRPRLLHAVENPETGQFKPVRTHIAESFGLSNAAWWRLVSDAMVDVVHEVRGTASAIGRDAPYLIAGKTGTAQVFGLEEDEEYDEEEIAFRLRDHALFIAFAPADDPRIAVAVVVENGGSGGRTAAPVARKVMDYYFSERNKMGLQQAVAGTP